jgi:putative transposase
VATHTTTRSLNHFNGLYKAELIQQRGWRGLDDVEFETLEYVNWFNHRRLHGEIGMIPPAELEAAQARRAGDRPVGV